MKVIIIGGGIGGLALTAGLRRNGFDVTVYDRDTDPAATGGYHITLDGPAQQALRELLEPEHYETLLASASAVRRRPPDVWFDWKGRQLGTLDVKGHDPDSIDVDRITLRLVLAESAGQDLRLGLTCISVERDPASGGAVTARFADGSAEHGDVLVGADGPRSLVAQHLAGGPTNHPAGIIGVSGRTPASHLDAAERQRLGPRSSLAVGPRGTALYAGYLDPVGFAVLDAAGRRAAVTSGPTYIWGAMFPDSAETQVMRDQHGSELRETTLRMLRTHGWTDRPLQIVSRTAVDDVTAYRFNAGPTQVRAMAPWPAGSITALGDAVHATPPTAGKGAGTAIIDAAALARELAAARAGTKTLRVAVSDFEADMRHRGSAVVALSMQTVHRVLATSTAPGSAVTRASLPLLAGTTAIKTRLNRAPS